MSVRDNPVLWLNARKAGSGATALGGNVVLKTPAHHLDGPEHLTADDTTTLDATVTEHGLLPKLSGDPSDALLGDGTWGPASASLPVEEDGSSVVASPTALDFRHGLDVTDVAGVAQVDVDEAGLTVTADLAAHEAETIDAHDASAISYDHTSSGLTATQVQAALDELATDLGAIGGGPTPTYLWKPIMVSMPNIVTTDGQPVYQPLVTTDGEAIMALVPVP